MHTHTHTHTHTHVLWNVFVLMSPQPNKACTPKHYKSNTTQSGNPTSLLTLYAPFSLPAVTSRNEYLTHRVCVFVSLCMYMWEHSEVEGGGISTLIVTTGTVWIIQRGPPLNVALCFPGLLAFPPWLLTSQLDSDTAGMHVSEPLRAQLPEVRVQADRPAPRWPIGRKAVLPFFTSCCPSELAWGRCRSSWRTALMRQVVQWKFDAQCALYFVLCCLRSAEAAAEDGCFHDIKRNPWIILLGLCFLFVFDAPLTL